MTSKLFGTSERAARSAFGVAKKAFKIPDDKSLELYGKLDVGDFTHIQEVYGTDGLSDYVKQMEAKRLRGGT